MKRFLRDTYLTWTERHRYPHQSIGLAPRLFGVVARPASWLYRTGVGASWTFKRRKPFSGTSDKKIAVIASPLVGGVGKSPLVALLARAAHQQGIRTAIVTRGYAATRPSLSPVTVRTDAGNIDAVGDEAVMLAQQCSGTVMVAQYPEIAVDRLARDPEVDLILIDDGVTRRWQGERRILVFTASDLDAPIRYLPAGRWRIPPKHALPAHGVVVIVDAATIEPSRQAAHQESLARWGMDLPTAWYTTQASEFARLDLTGCWGKTDPPDTQPFVFCGLAHPSRFQHTLQSIGVEPAGVQWFPDHHPYAENDLRTLTEKAKHSKSSWLLTTHKDAVKIRPEWLNNMPLYILRISLALADGADMLSVILERTE